MKPEQPQLDLSDDEAKVLQLLKEETPIALADLKTKAALSNKKWDKAIKGLTSKKQAQVTKNEKGLWVSILDN
jgi:lysyl-tRNA synthetase class 2